jgi:TolB protein
MYRILIVLFLCQIVWLTSCEEDRIEPVLFGAISGTVVDDETGAPILSASVSTSPATTTQVTDTLGNCFFSKVPEGAVIVRAEANGYISETESVTVYENDTLKVSLRMRKTVSSNQLPSAPQYLIPAHLTTGAITDTIVLKWRRATDPNANDLLTYQLLLTVPGQTTDTIISDLRDTCFTLRNLKFNTNYSWQVITSDTSKTPVYGAVWQFSTRSIPDNPILFARKTNGNYQIWSANIQGADQIQLTNLSANQWRPRRNAQRTRIAFLSDAGINTGLYTMLPDGSDIKLLTTFPVAGVNDLDLDFCWSPDGSRVLFMNGNKLYSVTASGSGLMLFATAPTGFQYTEVDWNANTNQVLARLNGSNYYESVFHRYQSNGTLIGIEANDRPGSEGGPAFNITGDRFLLTVDSSGLNSADGRQLDATILIRAIGSSNEVDASVLKPAGTNDLDPRYSANGAQIIFVNTDNTGLGAKDIWTMNLAGTNRKLLIVDGEMPDWR